MRYPTYILVTMSFAVSAMMSVYFLHSNAEHWKLRYHNLYEQTESEEIGLGKSPLFVYFDKRNEYNISMSCSRESSSKSLNFGAQLALKQLHEEALLSGLKIMTFETRRGLCRQTELYKQGTTKRLHSEHLLGNAFDIAFLDQDGKATWKSSRWEELGAIGKGLGLMWGGDFKTIYDPGHFELKQEINESIVDYKAEEERYNQSLIESKFDELGCGGNYDMSCQLIGLCEVADYPWVIPGEHNYQTISECINQILEF